MLPRVNLADLSAKELADEMVRRIPAHTPEWRNARAGDPGRAMIDLFAYMGETILYRANLTPRRMRLEFLNLLNLKQRPATSARGLLALTHKAPAGAVPVFARPGVRINGPKVFETRAVATIQPLEGRVFIKRALDEDAMEELSDVLASLSEVYGVTDMAPYETEQVFGPGDKARSEGVDLFAESVDQTAWIALFALDETPAARTAAQLALDAQPALLNLGVIPKLDRDDPLAPASDPLEGVDWAVTAPPLTLSDAGILYRDLPVDEDRTEGFTREGTLRLVMPSFAEILSPSNDIEDEVDAGVGDRPPRLDDPELAGRLLCWVRLRAGDAAATLPVSWMGVNAVEIDQTQSYSNVLLGTATGVAGARFALPARNVDPESIGISVFEEGLGFRPWSQVTDLGACARDERCYEVDAEAGQVAFGDGITGKSLPKGTRVRLDIMRAGGGADGNVSAGSLAKIELPGLLVHQPADMHGGVDAEALETAEKRVGAMLHHRNRCVTEADYKSVTAELGIPRTEVIPGFRPHQRLTGAAGVVTVMAVPEGTVRRAPNPRADRRMLERIHAHLDPRRPLGTELYVVSPEYVSFGISTAISIRDGFAREEVVKAVKERLYSFFWPLAGGGGDGSGWTLGRDINAQETEVEIARVPGVRIASGVNLFLPDAADFDLVGPDSKTGIATVELSEWQLAELLNVVVAVDVTDPPASMSYGQGGADSTGSGRGIAVPVVPEVC